MNIAKLQPANSQVQPMPTDIARVVIRIAAGAGGRLRARPCRAPSHRRQPPANNSRGFHNITILMT